MIDPKTSRYAQTPTIAVEDASGETVRALDLRTIPHLRPVYSHTPLQGERLDQLAFRYYRDPLRFWRICDAADQLDPFDVVVPGRRLPIPPNR